MRTTPLVFALTLAIAAAAPAGAQPGSTGQSPHKRLERKCDACHVPTSFHDIRFSHQETGFALEGPHAVARCLACHNVEDFSRVDNSCASCHSDVHRGRNGGTCERCHNPGGWRVFDSEDIHASTSFPVMGRHLLVDCEACHPGMPEADFRNASPECIGCHRSDYESVASPDHAASGFSTDCRECHELTAWIPAVMSDHDGIFPIFSGGHHNRWNQCSDCHVSAGNYRVFECLECHAHTVENTDPHHTGMPGYSYTSVACLDCHPTGSAGRYAEHDAQFFPIYSGTHIGRWTDCASCHTAGTTDFSCIDCHDHNQPDTDPIHAGMTGYAYTSAACFDCHPDGRAGEYADHDAAFFPIYSGKHANRWDNCATCHEVATDKSVFTCFNCHEHSQSRMDDKHLGEVDGYSYDNAECLRCHPDGRKEN
jgi:hypothetical protein